MEAQTTQLTAEEVQRRIYAGIMDQRLREFYETPGGLEYLSARHNLLNMPNGPATP